MKACFHDYLTDCPNPLNHEPIRLVGGGNENPRRPNRKIPFYISPLPPSNPAYFCCDTAFFMQIHDRLALSLV
jgi:hypothetical protein